MRNASSQRNRSRLHVELLEDRLVPSGMSLVGNWDGHDHLYADLWAEQITSGRFRGQTFAYLGHYFNQGGVDIINITDPAHPTLASVFKGVGGDNELVDVQITNGIGYFSSNTDGSVYIVDLSNPNKPVQLSRISTAIGGLPRTHTLFVDGDFLYQVHPMFPEIRVFDVSNPAHPSFVRSIASPSGFGIHEATVRNGRLYGADFHNSGLTTIFDVSKVGDLSVPVPLVGTIISGIGTHTSISTEDGKFVIVAHETVGLGVDIYDIRNPAKPKLASNIVFHVQETSMPHQPVVVGNLMYLSAYEAGVLVYDIADPYHPVRIADYDTYTGPYGEEGECAGLEGHTAGPFTDMAPYPIGCGAWGVYPFLGSDRILVSDLDHGLFIVSMNNPPQALTAANFADSPIDEALSLGDVQPLLTEALAFWQSAGVDTSSLGAINIRIDDLGGAILGQAAGSTIWLDANAAGWGWFIDSTPWDDVEFATPSDQGEENRMDLLTTLAHEVGHLLGHDHDEDGVMADTLTTGMRRLPANREFADWAALVEAIAAEGKRRSANA